MDRITIYCRILEIRYNLYTEIVIEDLNRDFTDDLKYVTIVKLPNWIHESFNIGDIGYLQYQVVNGGKTQWFDKNNNELMTFKYDNNYFISFIKEKDKCLKEKFKF